MQSLMSKLQTVCLTVSLAALLCVSIIPRAESADPIRQYKAAMTRIFLWKYYAFPIFRQNPLFPGHVVQVDNEVLYLSDCYLNQIPGNYKAIDEYIEGMIVATNINAKVKGEIMSKHIAEIEAVGAIKFEKTSVITVSPLSVDRGTIRLTYPTP